MLAGESILEKITVGLILIEAWLAEKTIEPWPMKTEQGSRLHRSFQLDVKSSGPRRTRPASPTQALRPRLHDRARPLRLRLCGHSPDGSAVPFGGGAGPHRP